MKPLAGFANRSRNSEEAELSLLSSLARTFRKAWAANEWSRGDTSDIDGQTERSNGAFGKSDIEGKTAREAASELGKERVSNGREHMSQFQCRTRTPAFSLTSASWALSVGRWAFAFSCRTIVATPIA